MDIEAGKAIGHFRVTWYVCLQKGSTRKHVHIKMSIAGIFFIQRKLEVRKWPTADVSIWTGDGGGWMGGRGEVNGEVWRHKQVQTQKQIPRSLGLAAIPSP